MARQVGTAADDTLIGGDGRDILIGGGGTDSLVGNGGGDILVGSGTLEGGAGNDRYSVVGLGRDRPVGIGDPVLFVDLGPGNDRMVLNAHDSLFNRASAPLNALDLGPGNDRLTAAGGTPWDFIYLGEGADTAWLLADTASTGNIDVSVVLGDNLVHADDETDVIHIDASGAAHALYGFGPTDRIVVHGLTMTDAEVALRTDFSSDAETHFTLVLPDSTQIWVYKDWSGPLAPGQLAFEAETATRTETVRLDDGTSLRALFGTADDETLSRKGGAIFAGAGDDVLRGTGRPDRLYGEAGDDRLLGKGGADSLYGGYGADTIFGGGGDDYIETGTGESIVRAGPGDDDILVWRGTLLAAGQAGADRIVVDDTTLGFSGAAITLSGGAGADDFVLATAGTGLLVIEDFRPGRDDLLLEHWPDYFDADRIRSERDDILDRAAHTDDLRDDYPVDGLVLTVVTTEILLAGLDAGDIGPGDVPL